MEVGGQTGRHREVKLADILIAVFAIELQRKGAECTGGRVGRARFKARVEWTDLAGTLAAMGSRFQPKDLIGFLFGDCFVPGKEVGIDREDSAYGRGRHQTSFSGKEMNRKFIKGNLGQFFEVTLSCPVWGLGFTDPTNFALIPKPDATINSRYWSFGSGSPM